MWDGSFKSKREVSLRGKSARQSDRKTHVEKLRLERQKRQEEIKRRTMARKIQSFARSCLVRDRIKSQVRLKLYNMLMDVEKVFNMSPGFKIPESSMKELVKKCLFCYGRSRSLTERDLCCVSLVAKYLNTLLTSNIQPVEPSQYYRFVSILLLGVSEQGVCDALNNLLAATAGKRCLLPFQVPIGDAMRSLLQIQTPTPSHLETVQSLWLCVAEALNISDKVRDMSELLVDVLAIPSNRLQELGVLNVIIDNITVLGWTRALQCLRGDFLTAQSFAVVNTILTISLAIQNKKNTEAGGELLEIEVWKIVAVLLKKSHRDEDLLDKVEGLQNLRNPWFVQDRLGMFLSTKDIDTRKRLVVGFVQVLELVRMYWTKPGQPIPNNALSTLSPSSTVVSAVAFSPKKPLIAPLWGILLDASLSEISDVIPFACASTSKLLSALDDEEVFVKQTPFRVQDLAQIACFLRKLLYGALWENSTGLKPAVVQKLIDLFNQLHERHLRHKIMPYEEWLFPSIDLRELGIHGLTVKSFVRRQQQEEDRMDEDNSSDEEGDDGSGNTKMQKADVAPQFASDRVKRVLNKIPQVVPFEQRVLVFDHYLDEDILSHDDMRRHRTTIRITVRRGYEYEDAFRQLSQYEHELKSRVQIEFVNQQGLPEAGIDGGGVFKEFLLECCKQGFDPDRGYWKSSPMNKLYPNPNETLNLAHFEFLGKIVGKAVYEGVLMELNLADFFLNLVLGNRNHLHDLQSLDPEIYKNILMLKSMSDPSVLDLTFSVSTDNGDVDLIPNGSTTPVNSTNYIQYIASLSNFRLNDQFTRQTSAFRRGFSCLVALDWIIMFNQRELQLLIGGSDEGFKVEDMMKHCTYSGGYHPDQPYMKWFWEVVKELNQEQRGLLLKFITSCSKPPLHGFGVLNPRLCISQVRDSAQDSRLCTASTCVNLLKLPKYSTKDILRNKLVYSITSASGFELS